MREEHRPGGTGPLGQRRRGWMALPQIRGRCAVQHGMVVRCGRATPVPATWHAVSTPPRGLATLHDLLTWCRHNAGMERADWQWEPMQGRFRFRKQEHAVLFQLTWC